MKRDIINRIRERLTPEKLEEMKQKRIKAREKMSPDFQFGYFVGEDIFNNFLPCLDIDMLYTNKVIKVSKNDKKEFERIDKLHTKTIDWSSIKAEDESEEWKNLIKFRREMEIKYLPPVLECPYWLMNISNMEEFKKGLRSSLWNCDICHYKIETDDDIEIFDDEECYFTTIRLKYGH